jgi:DNA-binding transcriptional LysR family regulator
VVLEDWELPPMQLWAVFPAGRTPTSKARTFAAFVERVMRTSASRSSCKAA